MHSWRIFCQNSDDQTPLSTFAWRAYGPSQPVIRYYPVIPKPTSNGEEGQISFMNAPIEIVEILVTKICSLYNKDIVQSYNWNKILMNSSSYIHKKGVGYRGGAWKSGMKIGKIWKSGSLSYDRSMCLVPSSRCKFLNRRFLRILDHPSHLFFLWRSFEYQILVFTD